MTAVSVKPRRPARPTKGLVKLPCSKCGSVLPVELWLLPDEGPGDPLCHDCSSEWTSRELLIGRVVLAARLRLRNRGEDTFDELRKRLGADPSALRRWAAKLGVGGAE